MIDTKNLSGDIFGGITAAVVALPLALAFGVQSGMGAIAGLYGAIALGILAAVFGGTKTQISGPTGPMAVVAAAVIAGEIAIYGSLEAAIGTIVGDFCAGRGLSSAYGCSRHRSIRTLYALSGHFRFYVGDRAYYYISSDLSVLWTLFSVNDRGCFCFSR